MATKDVYFWAFDASTGLPLAGIDVSTFFAGGSSYAYYKVNGVGATAPSVTDVGRGLYKFTATLAAGETLAWQADCGASASSRTAQGTVDFADCLTPAVAADVPSASTVAAAVWGAGTRTLTSFGTLVADVAAAVWAAGARTLTGFGTLVADAASAVDALLSTNHGSGTWGGAGGDGSQAITLQVRDAATDNPLSGARVEVYDAATKKAEGRTDTAGNVELLLDPGTYETRITLGAYSFSATDVTVTAPNTVSPTHVDGTALPSTSTTVVGLSRTLSLAPTDAPNTDGVSGLVAGDNVTLTRSFANVPAGRTIAKVRATWKVPADDLAADDVARVQLEVTTVLGAAGQITNAGGSGTGAATLKLTAAQHLAIAAAGATDFDVQVTFDDDTVRTPEVGTWDARAGVTSSAP